MQSEDKENTGAATIILVILVIMLLPAVWMIPFLTDSAKMFLDACIITLGIGVYMGLHPDTVQYMDNFGSNFDLLDLAEWIGAIITVGILAGICYFVMKSAGIDILDLTTVFK